MNHKQYQLINELKTVLNELKKEEVTREVAKEVVRNFHSWLLSK